MPFRRLAPDLLSRHSWPADSIACWIMLQVVVLPFVPVTTMISMPEETTSGIFGAIFMAISPGMAVPPRPVLRRTERIILQDAMDAADSSGFGLDIDITPSLIRAGTARNLFLP